MKSSLLFLSILLTACTNMKDFSPEDYSRTHKETEHIDGYTRGDATTLKDSSGNISNNADVYDKHGRLVVHTGPAPFNAKEFLKNQKD